MKYYFFRDLDNNGNFDNNTSFHPAGIVIEIKPESERNGDKDVVIEYLNPFTGQIITCWRAYDEIEIMETNEFSYNYMQELFNKIETIEI